VKRDEVREKRGGGGGRGRERREDLREGKDEGREVSGEER
jgi:hypothetical protein